MSIVVYKIIHLLGLVLLFQSLGAILFAYMAGSGISESPHKKMLLSMHGLGLLLLFIGGFGMATRLGIMGSLPGWVWIKIGIWLLLGASLFFVKKKPETARLWWYLIIALGLAAAYLGLFQPF
ncbi:MAG: hypothetical protein BMS9Abin05_0864 [Rhodothermia bacterium]|nr:MAG: hypothetical protein BMS9Abin05_0864 [Rhodothermia bacterium]